ncbi:hypothetical protein [Klebsiella pneumoniae]|uniref:hypothetical protein n=1 Tax=Klebsiella pneumoniae TaxID=573 RepID=UPI00115520E0|nr:hypothetical protein [Klebsiella pneumoniae]HBR1845617.1 hypothetical protein [Klebsiella quasipneumoniae subsp. quasipneumoniae]MCP5580215.1 hypothetical protein [Klebsiella pneumoniae]MCP5585637.1 hypothetical protein [Klebsiella pneumoniae]MCP5720729.1 hypothetical protein [Klebsiella pneumoniae]WEA97367.1 hypothetical protein PUW63_05785 [Klebsiella pneumoniae]
MQPAKCFFHSLCFVPPNPLTSGIKIFGFSEFLASLALLVVVFTVTDTRYKFRISISPLPLYIITFIIIALTGFISLLSDIWSATGWWVLDTSFGIKIATQSILGFCFLFCFMLWIYYAFLRPPTFSKRNKIKYINALYKYITKGVEQELAIIADELGRSANVIIKYAGRGDGVTTQVANDILFLIGNKNFCKVLVKTSPRTATYFFAGTGTYGNYDIPLHQFSSNISQEVIKNKNSIIYHEDNSYYSGLMGEIQEWSKSFYGNYLLVDSLHRGHLSPFDFNYKSFLDFDSEQWDAYFRVGIIYLKEKLQKEKFIDTSSVLNSILDKIKHCTQNTYMIDKLEDESKKNELMDKLRSSINFIADMFDVTSKLQAKSIYQYNVKDRDNHVFDMHYYVSDILLELLFNASKCQADNFFTWHIQNNIVWDGIFFPHKENNGDFYKKSKRKLIRKIYNELNEIINIANFKNTRIAGLILNVLGLAPGPCYATKSDRRLLLIKNLTQNIIKEHFLTILEQQPEVAQNMFPKCISYDPEKKCLIKTYSRGINKEAPKHYLYLD